MLDNFRTDIRHALRQVARTPGFAGAVIGTVAITIGASATVFSLYHALVLRSLPVADPSRIVVVQPVDPKGQSRSLYHESYLELAKLPVFDHLALYTGGGMMMNEARGTRAEGLIEAVTPGFFEALGLRPFLGRFFVERDFIEVDAPTVVLSHAMWQRLFAGDTTAIGERVLINAHPMTVIGVTPPSFKGFYVDGGFGFSVPLSVLNRHLGTNPNRPLRGLQAIGRLRTGVSIVEAQAAVSTSWQSIRIAAVPSQLPITEIRDVAGSSLKVEGLAAGFSSLRTRFQTPLGLLLSATVVLLAIGCVNLSGLLLARTAAREHQFAVLLALGAPRLRFVQQALTEAVVLSLLGAALSLPLVWWGTSILTNTIWTARDPIALATAPDLRVLLVTAIAAIVTGILMAALPAARAARQRSLRLQSQREVASSLGFWGRGLLIAQIALSLVLLIGAGLFARSLSNLRQIDAGFEHPEARWSRLFGLPGAERPKDIVGHYSSLMKQIEQLPQVQSAAMSSLFPTYFNASQFLTRHAVARADSTDASSAAVDALKEIVTPRFFETAGITRRQGRDFSWTDAPGAPPVAIISESLSRRLFPHASPVGAHIRVGTEERHASIEVIGVAADASVGDLRDPHVPVVYLSRMQESMPLAPVLLFRPTADVASAEGAIQALLESNRYDYGRGWYSVAQNADTTLVQERVLASLSAFLAAVALLLAFLGIHGLLAFSITQRTRELGIHMALGATPWRLRRMVLREALFVAVVGVAMGLALAVAVTRIASSLLFGVDAADPVVMLTAAAFFVLVSLGASARSASRAASLDPAHTLRSE